MDRRPTHKPPSNTLALRVLIIVMLIVTLSCTVLSSDEGEKVAEEDLSAQNTRIAEGVQQTVDAQAQAVPPTEPPPPPTAPPLPTSIPVTEQAFPTQPPELEEEIDEGEQVSAMIDPYASAPGDVYYNEKFEAMEGWWVYPLRGDETGWGYEVFDNRLRAEIVSQDTWVYYMFEGGGNFQDVRIDITVENRASNTNFVGIICRSSDTGWYEANILNTGEYFIYYGYPDDASVDLMYKGATRLIKTGRSINSYAMVCEGEQLTLGINGEGVVTIPLKAGDFRYLADGQVGVSVSTSYAIPVVVDFLQFVMSVP
jgi:hypothetical protein